MCSFYENSSQLKSIFNLSANLLKCPQGDYRDLTLNIWTSMAFRYIQLLINPLSMVDSDRTSFFFSVHLKYINSKWIDLKYGWLLCRWIYIGNQFGCYPISTSCTSVGILSTTTITSCLFFFRHTLNVVSHGSLIQHINVSQELDQTLKY